MIKPKKYLGQHFLKDDGIARQIVSALSKNGYNNLIEIGPGTGALTKFLVQDKSVGFLVVEVDGEAVEFLRKTFPELRDKIIEEDFLKLDLELLFNKMGAGMMAIIGNFPYNISSQILFKVYENRDKVVEVVGMFQKEVAERISAVPKGRNSGILTILLQAFYKVDYLFTVNENVFSPPPKVKSAVIRIIRNEVKNLGCNEELFKQIVKTAFNQRRKKLSNALGTFLEKKNILINERIDLFAKRAEQLTVQDFILLTGWIERGGREERNS